MNNKLPIIAFKGKGGSGKSTAAAYLIDKGYGKTSFAEPLRRMLRALGVTDDELVGSLKESPCTALSGRSPRVALQLLGTEWGRALDSDFWTNIWRARAKSVLARGIGVVVDDCRFPNEAEAVRAMGGYVIEIINTSAPPAPVGLAGHASETQDFDPDITVINDGKSLAALHVCLAEALDILSTEYVEDRLAA